MSFCSEAWDAIARYIYTGLQGGSIMKGWMKEMINITEYAQMITEALPKGILLNTKDAKFNSMVIGWGALGTVWGQPIPSIAKVCGMQSGRDIDKEKEAHLTLENPEKISVSGIKEYPLTLECKVLYSQRQELESIPNDIRDKMYPQDVDGTYPMANRDAHTAYIGEIVAAYIIK